LGIGPNPQSPIPNPQSPKIKLNLIPKLIFSVKRITNNFIHCIKINLYNINKMKSSGLFLIILLTICHFSNTQKAFSHVSSLLVNFKKSNIDEQKHADERERNERKWCNDNIATQTKIYQERVKDVTSVEAHLLYLQKSKAEHIKDKDHRCKRRKANDALLEKFKKERCDSNNLFVKNLRDHMEGIEILGLLRQDIIDYFKGKLPKPAPVQVPKPAPVPVPKPVPAPIPKPAPVPKPVPVPAPVPKPVLVPAPVPKPVPKPAPVPKPVPVPAPVPKPVPGPAPKAAPTTKEQTDGDASKTGNSSGGEQTEITLIQLETESIENDLKVAQNLVKRVHKIGNYQHLFSASYVFVLAELEKFGEDVEKHTKNVESIVSTRERTSGEVGKAHIDNTRGELKKLATPDYEGQASFNANTEKKILKLIDDLVNHLKESRETLIKDELKAATDFAEFQNKMIKENKHLSKTIKELKQKIAEFEVNIKLTQVQLGKRKALRDDALAKLKALEKLCNDKYAYFKKETQRRNDENKIIDRAISIFDSLMKKAAKYRASGRVDSNYNNEKYKAENVGQRVTGAKEGILRDNSKLVKERNQVVF
jgi:hypothetical protein